MDGQNVFVNITEENSEETKVLKTKDVITVKYSGINIYNKLIQPNFFRVRSDFNWKDIVEQFNNEIKNK